MALLALPVVTRVHHSGAPCAGLHHMAAPWLCVGSEPPLNPTQVHKFPSSFCYNVIAPSNVLTERRRAKRSSLLFL